MGTSGEGCGPNAWYWVGCRVSGVWAPGGGGHQVGGTQVILEDHSRRLGQNLVCLSFPGVSGRGGSQLFAHQLIL